MSNVITNHMDELRSRYTPSELLTWNVVAPEVKAAQNAERVRKIATQVGGFAHYFVVNDVGNGNFHDEQHKQYCEELGIDDGLHPRTFTLSVSETHASVLRRRLDYHEDETVYGIEYSVEHIPYDRD